MAIKKNNYSTYSNHRYARGGWVITFKNTVNIALIWHCESALPYNGKEIKISKLRQQNNFRSV